MKIKIFILTLVSLFLLSNGTFPQAVPLSENLSGEDRKLLRQIAKDSLNYFIVHSDRKTGLTRDNSRPGSPASIAATGFSLACLAVAKEHGWISYNDAYNQIEKTLLTLKDRAEHKNGFFYHFLDARTGRRAWASEASSIDTAIAVAGALVAGKYFPGTEIERLAGEIYDRVNWEWMLNDSLLLCHGWKPKTGFLPYYWDSYNELIILQALAIGSETYPVPAEAWDEWTRFEDTYNGKTIVYSHSGSLFTYQYSHAFIDFRNLWDLDINYYKNSVNATLANKEFCAENGTEYKSYGKDSWGLSACVGPGGYKAYGAPPGMAKHDGTIAVYAPIASLVFTPEESIACMKHIYENYAEKLYGRCGFKDSYNLDKRFFAYEYIGIDQGITVMMIENYLTGGVWNRFMQVDAVKKWIAKCGLKAD